MTNPHGVTRGVVAVALDGATREPDSPLDLTDDGATHHVKVVLG